MHDRSRLRALTFDTYGTVVDWRSSVLAELEAFGAQEQLTVDWGTFLADWKAAYRPTMDAINRGAAPWVTVDAIYRARLDELAGTHGLGRVSRARLDDLARAWWRLRPWPDAVAGLGRLKARYIISPLSNASFIGMVELARFATLPWDCVITAENARAYKPQPAVYRTALSLLGASPSEVMMVAAHNYDLAAARAEGMATAFVPRPTEFGPGQTSDLHPESDWDIVADDFVDLARQLGC